MSDLKWTKKKPTEPGHYWLKEKRRLTVNETKVICCIVLVDKEEEQWQGQTFFELFVYWHGNECDANLSEVEGRWYGPLKTP